VTCSIQVSGVSKLTTDHLELYFESTSGTDVAKVGLKAEDGYAVVEFADSTGKRFLWTFMCCFLV